MYTLDSVAGILSGVSVALSLLCVWLCQVVQRRIDAVSAEMITDHLRLLDDVKTTRADLKKEIEALRQEVVGRAHYLESRARDSLH